MTQHSQTIVLAFNPNLAAQVGLGESIILSQMAYWLSKTKHFIQGKPWVYNSYTAWEKQFPFWSKSTIRRLIASLETKGLIISQNFNAKKTNRTKWYSLDFDKIPDSERVTSQVQKEIRPSDQDEQFHVLNLNTSLKTKNTLQRMKERVAHKFGSHKPAKVISDLKKKKVLETWELSAEVRIQTIQKLDWDEERIESELLRFKTYYAAKENLKPRDWDAVWHLWCARAQSFALERQKRFEERDKNFGLSSKSSDDCVQKWRQERESEQALEKDISRELVQELSKERRVWLNVSKTLIKQVGAATYKSWLKDICVQTVGDKEVVLKAKNRLTADWVSTNFFYNLKEAFESALSGGLSISVVW